jgi:hypothetical protein
MEEERTSCSRPGLGEHLCRQNAEGEAGVDQFVGQLFGRDTPTLEKSVEADFVGIRHSALKVVENSTIEEIRDVNGVTRASELLRKFQDARRHSVGVMEQQDLSHMGLLSCVLGSRSETSWHEVDCQFMTSRALLVGTGCAHPGTAGRRAPFPPWMVFQEEQRAAGALAQSRVRRMRTREQIDRVARQRAKHLVDGRSVRLRDPRRAAIRSE